MSNSKKAVAALLMAGALYLGIKSAKPAGYQYEEGTCYILQLKDKDGNKHPSALMVGPMKDDKRQAVLYLDMMLPVGISMEPAQFKKESDQLEPVQVDCKTGEPLK